MKIDLEALSFSERLHLGAENAIRCMGVTSQDRVFIFTDYEIFHSLHEVSV